MNEKLAASESRLALMEMKCSSSEICEDTPITISCSVCGKIFRDLNCLEAHFHAQHTGRRQPNQTTWSWEAVVTNIVNWILFQKMEINQKHLKVSQ